MKALRATLLILFLLIPGAAAAAPDWSPLAGPCSAGAVYDPACDVDHDGDVDIFDIQLAASHWNQRGTWISDNDHDHLGQRWVGVDNSLVISGTFGNYPSAPSPLVLANGTGDGLTVTSAGASGLRVESAGLDGVNIASAAVDGLYVLWAGNAGTRVISTNGDGAYVGSAGDNGFQVDNAGEDGVYVNRAGNPSAVDPSVGSNGLEVGGAESHGLYVGRADTYGVYVKSAGNDGLRVGTAEGYGVYVGAAGADGLLVYQAGTPSRVGFTAHSSGLEIGGSEGSGVMVGRADKTGFFASSAGEHGVYVDSAGDPSQTIAPSGLGHGVVVAGAEMFGLAIGRSDSNGVNVTSAGGDGMSAGIAADDGVSTLFTGDYGGWFNDDIFVNGACNGCLLAMFGVNNGNDPLQSGDLVAVSGVEGNALTRLQALVQVEAAESGQAVIGAVIGRADVDEKVFHIGEGEVEIISRLVPRGGAVAPGDYLSILYNGPVQVRFRGDITAGQRLVVAEDGVARAQRTVTIEGVELAESTPVVGIALESTKPGQDTIWVLVNPQ